MIFYKHYIGDFDRSARHLSPTQRGVYLSLMHHYYSTELPLPNDLTTLFRIAGATKKFERDAVKSVLGFFEVVESGLMQNRIEAEIQKAGEQADTNRRIAREREAKRRIKKSSNEQSTNRDTTLATNIEPSQTSDSRRQGSKQHPANDDANTLDAYVDVTAWDPPDQILFDLEINHEIPIEFSRVVLDEFRSFYADKGGKQPNVWCSRFIQRVTEQWGRKQRSAT